jgi:hypothetical protein
MVARDSGKCESHVGGLPALAEAIQAVWSERLHSISEAFNSEYWRSICGSSISTVDTGNHEIEKGRKDVCNDEEE